MMLYLLTIVRHFLAILTGWVATALVGAGLNLSTDQITEIQGAITGIGVIVFTAVYVAVEKALKPWWVRHFGESQPGETAQHGHYGEGA